jgi:hypothetical protein
MAEPVRLRYRIAITERPTGHRADLSLVARNPVPGDRDGLAELVLDAYIGTIDYHREGIEDARGEIDDYLAGDPILECSWVAQEGDLLLAAILDSRWEEAPLVGYIMTRTSVKAEGWPEICWRDACRS